MLAVIIIAWTLYLQVRCGEKRWYTLKDKKLLNRTKGAIMLEIDVVYNPVRTFVSNYLISFTFLQF